MRKYNAKFAVSRSILHDVDEPVPICWTLLAPYDANDCVDEPEEAAWASYLHDYVSSDPQESCLSKGCSQTKRDDGLAAHLLVNGLFGG